MPWGQAIGAIGASLIGGAISHFSTKDANTAAVAEARTNREFQEEMSNSAMQRRVQDLKKAGINPMLAYTQGAASQPTGAQAPIQANQGSAQAMAQIAQTLAGTINLDKQRQVMDSQIDANKASAEAARAGAEYRRQEIPKIAQEIAESGERILKSMQDREYAKKAMTGMDIEWAFKDMETSIRQMDTQMRQEMFPYLKAVAEGDAAKARAMERAWNAIGGIGQKLQEGAGNKFNLSQIIEQYGKAGGETWDNFKAGMRSMLERLTNYAHSN